ncbi:MAG: hypothetical protein JST70_00775 [Bacteroidetes bacterium]|nr:hypothetical protein [Bacteroidota bacterium]
MQKQISSILATAATTILFFGLTLFSQCTKDPCNDIKCLHGGTCKSGTCKCPTGYEGTTCNEKENDKFTGNYVGNDCGSTETYVVKAQADTKTIWITVPDAFSGHIYGTVSGTTVSFPSQSLLIDTDYYTFSGSASLSGNTLSINYTVIDSDGNKASCNFVGTK